MNLNETGGVTAEEQVQQELPPERATPKQQLYLDPEGGYTQPEVGKQAELVAMTRQAPVSVNNLPTKAYLETAITPTVLRALTEVTKARPDNPLEFVAYYLLKHNPNRDLKNDGTPSGHRHPDDKPMIDAEDPTATMQSTEGKP